MRVYINRQSRKSAYTDDAYMLGAVKVMIEYEAGLINKTLWVIKTQMGERWESERRQ